MKKTQTQRENKKYGYHMTEIPKGVIGSSSKIMEEVLELIDAEQQKCKVMGLIELTDLVGAINAYLAVNAKGITLKDLETMSNITVRAFKNGFRK